MSSVPFDPAKVQAIRLIRRINNALLKTRNKHLAEYGLTAAQSDIIVYLIRNYKEKDEINQLDIQRHLQLSNPTVSGLLNRLEDKGFITRTSSIKDARYNCVKPTQKALDLAATMDEHMILTEETMLTGLSESERIEFIRLLGNVLANVEKIESEK